MVGDVRARGYQEALRAAGLDPHPDLLVRTPNDVPHAAQAADLLFSRAPRPTAVICATPRACRRPRAPSTQNVLQPIARQSCWICAAENVSGNGTATAPILIVAVLCSGLVSRDIFHGARP